MVMPSLISLDSMRTYGIPTTIDSVDISRMQGQVIVGIVDRLIDEAGHDVKDAIKLAVDVFREMYEKGDGGWVAKSSIRLGKGHGKLLHNKFFKMDKEDQVARIKAKQEKKVETKKSLMKRLMDKKKAKEAVKEMVVVALKDMVKGESSLDVLKRLKLRMKG